MHKLGLTHVYYGDGKGKTSAALGLALRASGHGFKVVIVQFLKNIPTGELKSLSRLPNVTVFYGQSGKNFTNEMVPTELKETLEIHNTNLRLAIDLVRKKQCDVLILDEALDAFHLGLLDENLFKDIYNNHEKVELVITGHMPSGWVHNGADYVTMMTSLKHPYSTGVTLRKGIEL